MWKRVIIALFVIPLFLAVQAMSATAQWVEDGVGICTLGDIQYDPQIASDGAGGAIMVWEDHRSGVNYDIWAQRIDDYGNVKWTVDGVNICAALWEQRYPQLVSDGSAGAIIVWQDFRNGNFDIYAQRVDENGAVQWTVDGVVICTATGPQERPKIVSDDAGGAIITWMDYRGAAYDIYAQRIDGDGLVQWTANGVSVCAAAGHQ